MSSLHQPTNAADVVETDNLDGFEAFGLKMVNGKKVLRKLTPSAYQGFLDQADRVLEVKDDLIYVASRADDLTPLAVLVPPLADLQAVAASLDAVLAVADNLPDVAAVTEKAAEVVVLREETEGFRDDSEGFADASELAAARAEAAAQDVEGVGIVVENLDAILDARNQAASAAEDATAAQTSAGIAQVSAGTYGTTAAGLAATTNGKVFGVPSTNDPESVRLYLNSAGTAVDTGKSIPSVAAVNRLEADTFPIDYLPNLWPNGDLALPTTVPSPGLAVQEPVTGVPELVDAGVVQMLRATPAAGGATRVNQALTGAQANALGILPGQRLVLGCLVYSSTGDNFPTTQGGFTIRYDDAAVIAPPGLIQSVQLSTKYRLYYGIWDNIRDRPFLSMGIGFTSGVSFPDAPGFRSITGFFEAHGFNVPTPTAGNWRRFMNWKAQPTRAAFYASVLAAAGGTGSKVARKLVLGGQGVEASIEVKRDGKTFKQTFTPYPNTTLVTSSVFNFQQTIIDGTLMKVAGDDAAPYRALGTTIGANHGYSMGSCIMAAHGKALVDIGSIWLKDGKQHVLLGFPNTGAVYLTEKDTNGNLAPGTYTHVSGATNTADIVVTAVTNVQFYPPFQNRKIRTIIDGIEVQEKSGTYEYLDAVSFIESYEVLTKAAIMGWFIAGNGKTGVIQPSGLSPAFAPSISYTFDRDGNCAIVSGFTVLDTMALQDIMFTQAGRIEASDGPVNYYVRKALPVTHAGRVYDYAMTDSSDTSTWTSRLNFSPDRVGPDGLAVDSLVMLSNTYGFATGYVPEDSASPAERRQQATVKFLQISNTNGKVYPAAIDKGVITLNPGDYFSVKAYRNWFVRTAERTSFYVVRLQGDDYLFVDWHNKTDLDRVPLPSDFVGRQFEQVEVRNGELVSKRLDGTLLIKRNAAGGYGYLILKVK